MEADDFIAALKLLDSIATSVERLADSNDKLAAAIEKIANYQAMQPREIQTMYFSLGEYPQFDWEGRVGAKVIARDKDGAIAIEFEGKTYTRRCPMNKYEDVIVYSRASGKEGEKLIYEWLVCFKEPKKPTNDVDPLHDRIRGKIRAAVQEKQAKNGGAR